MLVVGFTTVAMGTGVDVGFITVGWTVVWFVISVAVAVLEFVAVVG